MNFKKEHEEELIELMGVEAFADNERKLDEIATWIHNTEAKLRQCTHAKDIQATLEQSKPDSQLINL